MVEEGVEKDSGAGLEVAEVMVAGLDLGEVVCQWESGGEASRYLLDQLKEVVLGIEAGAASVRGSLGTVGEVEVGSEDVTDREKGIGGEAVFAKRETITHMICHCNGNGYGKS